MEAAEAEVLKLTLPGHYGISFRHQHATQARSEVDPTGSLWYTGTPGTRIRRHVLKLTLPGHYGI